MTTRPDLDALEQLDNAATQGPWTAEHDGPPESMSCPWVAGPFDRYMGGAQTIVEWSTRGEQSHADARFIAAARTALPALVAEVRRLRALYGLALDELDKLGTVAYPAWRRMRDAVAATVPTDGGAP